MLLAQSKPIDPHMTRTAHVWFMEPRQEGVPLDELYFRAGSRDMDKVRQWGGVSFYRGQWWWQTPRLEFDGAKWNEVDGRPVESLDDIWRFIEREFNAYAINGYWAERPQLMSFHFRTHGVTHSETVEHAVVEIGRLAYGDANQTYPEGPFVRVGDDLVLPYREAKRTEFLAALAAFQPIAEEIDNARF